MRQKQMTWRRFEQVCEELVESCFPKDSYKVKRNETVTYPDGVTKRVDIYITEKGGWEKRYLIDCKHFPIAPLDEREITRTLQYKRNSNASAAIMLISAVSNCPEEILGYAERRGLYVIQVSTVNREMVTTIRDALGVKKGLGRIVERTRTAFEQKQMTPKEFELFCLKLVKRCFPNDDYRVCYHPHRKYKDGVTKIMDINIAERRQGGKHYVIDCKHFQVNDLNTYEVDSTLCYKRKSNASAAIMLISGVSNCPEKVLRYAERKKVYVIPVSRTNLELAGDILNALGVEKELHRIIK